MPEAEEQDELCTQQRANPVAPALNNTLKLRIVVRSFSLSPSAGLIIGRTRDLFYFLAE